MDWSNGREKVTEILVKLLFGTLLNIGDWLARVNHQREVIEGVPTLLFLGIFGAGLTVGILGTAAFFNIGTFPEVWTEMMLYPIKELDKVLRGMLEFLMTGVS